ncbi:MAG: hypothetical protein WBA74_24475 [Cyclobacteriaceae bacterium]
MEYLSLSSIGTIIGLLLIVFVILFLSLRLFLKRKVGLIWQMVISFILLLIVSNGAYFYVQYRLTGDHYTKMEFDEELWIRDETIRISMVDDLIDSGLLTGKNPREVIDLLGKPTNIDRDSISYIDYDLGNADVGFSIHRVLLYMELEQGVVSVVKKHSVDMD